MFAPDNTTATFCPRRSSPPASSAGNAGRAGAFGDQVLVTHDARDGGPQVRFADLNDTVHARSNDRERRRVGVEIPGEAIRECRPHVDFDDPSSGEARRERGGGFGLHSDD